MSEENPIPEEPVEPAFRIITLADGRLARVTRVDATDIGFDLGVAGPDGEFIATALYQGVPPIPSEEPMEEWPDDATLAAHISDKLANPIDITPPVVLTPLTVISRMTPQEQAAILASDDPAVRVWVGMAGAALEIRSDDPRTALGFALLESKGLLAPGRAAELMQP